MTLIASRPRSPAPRAGDGPVPLTGTFRSPRGRLGHMRGSLRVHRLVIVPGGTFVTGVFTGELREDDGSLVGVDSRRATAAADLERERGGFAPVVRPLRLDLMGLTVELGATRIDPRLALVALGGGGRPGRYRSPGLRAVPPS